MKRIITLAVMLLGLQQMAGAQTPQGALSLSDALQIALDNRTDLKIQKANVQIAESQVDQVNARKLPQISSNLDFRYNSTLQTNVLPANVFKPNTPSSEVKFGTTYNTMLGFNYTEALYNPTNRGDTKIATAQTAYNMLSEKKTENDVKQDVTVAYFTALLWKEKVTLSVSNLERTNNIYNVAKGQLQQGIISSYDSRHYELDYENAYSENKKNKNSLNLALSDLWYKMGEDSVKTTVLSEDINSFFKQYENIDIKNPEINRPELDMEKQQLNIYQLNIKKQNLSYVPTVNLYGNYTFQYLSNQLQPFTGNYIYPFNYFGVQASIPIFDGLQKERVKQEYKLRSESSKLNYEKLVKDFSQDMRNATTALLNAQADLVYQKKNLDLANDLYQIDSDKLKSGLIKPNDLTTTYYTMQQTQTNYLNAAYNYLIAVVQYKRAVGSL